MCILSMIPNPRPTQKTNIDLSALPSDTPSPSPDSNAAADPVKMAEFVRAQIFGTTFEITSRFVDLADCAFFSG